MRVPSLVTSVTTKREHLRRSRRSRTAHKSPPSVSQPRPRSRCVAVGDLDVKPDGHPVAVFGDHLGAPLRVLQRGGAQVDPAQPVASAAASDSSSRIPPDSSTATSSLPTTSASSSRLVPRPNAASRSTRWIHSAPSRCQVIAASSAEPYSVSLPALPWTRRTARPSTTSTAGRSIKRLGFTVVNL